VLETLGLVLGIPASIATLVGVIYAATRAWPRFRDWLYQRTPYYRIDKLQEQVKGLEAGQVETREYAELVGKLTKNVDKMGDAQAQRLQAQMENYRKELTQVNDAVRDLTQRLIDLHLSTDHPTDLTTTEELSDQIKVLQGQFADFRASVTDAFVKMLRVQTNANNYLENHATLKELTDALDQMAAQPAKPDQQERLSNVEVALAEFLRYTAGKSDAAKKVIQAVNDAKERANHTE
jgi:acyl carrier protein phosphodiesterase